MELYRMIYDAAMCMEYKECHCNISDHTVIQMFPSQGKCARIWGGLLEFVPTTQGEWSFSDQHYCPLQCMYRRDKQRAVRSIKQETFLLRCFIKVLGCHFVFISRCHKAPYPAVFTQEAAGNMAMIPKLVGAWQSHCTVATEQGNNSTTKRRHKEWENLPAFCGQCQKAEINRVCTHTAHTYITYIYTNIWCTCVCTYIYNVYNN